MVIVGGEQDIPGGASQCKPAKQEMVGCAISCDCHQPYTCADAEAESHEHCFIHFVMKSDTTQMDQGC